MCKIMDVHITYRFIPYIQLFMYKIRVGGHMWLAMDGAEWAVDI